MGDPLDGVDVAGRRRAYLTRAHDLLAGGDDRLVAARDDWVAFVRATSGDVFATLPASGSGPHPEGAPPADRAFVDALYYDFLVDSLLDAVEEATGTRLANRDPRANTDALERAFGPLHDAVLAPDEGRERVVEATSALDALDADRLRDVYRAATTRDLRLALGEYYTPRGVADLALDALDVDVAEADVLDPGCGAGVFLAAAVDAKLAADGDRPPGETVRAVLDSVAGVDLNPVAVKTAKLVVLLCLRDHLAAADVDAVSVPVFLTDALALTRRDEPTLDGEPAALACDALVGNPPWVPWERLAETVKDAWRERYVDDLGLQPHEGVAARLGHSNDDCSVPYAWTCIHRYLRPGGRASFVLKRDIMRGPAGAVLRRLRVGDRPLALAHVHDLAAVEPFADGGANAAVYTFEADGETAFPVSTTVWDRRAGTAPDFSSGEAVRATLDRTETGLVPLDPDDPTTAWVRVDAERAALGECAHEIRHGVKDDAAAVFGLDRADLADVEPGRVFPYLKSRHVRKWGVTGHDLRLVPADRAGEDNEDRLRREYPDTYAYLERHREALTGRSSSWLDQGPFYTVFGLGPYTWAPYKVVWCRLGFKPDFAVVSTRSDPDLGEKPVVPGDHYMFVATEDREAAHFLCALLNAAPYQRTLRDLASDGKASLSKALVSELALPPRPETAWAERLATLSMESHDLVEEADGEPGPEVEAAIADREAEIDRLVESLLAEGALGDPGPE